MTDCYRTFAMARCYSAFRLDEKADCHDLSPHPVPLPQGERGPKNDLFIHIQTAVNRTRQDSYTSSPAGGSLTVRPERSVAELKAHNPADIGLFNCAASPAHLG